MLVLFTLVTMFLSLVSTLPQDGSVTPALVENAETQYIEPTISDITPIIMEAVGEPSTTPTSLPTTIPTSTPTPTQTVIPTKTPNPTSAPKVLPISRPTARPTTKPVLIATPIPAAGYTCDCSKTCPNLSCAEAQYQLNVCGCSQRDADDDGTACDADCQ